MTESRGGRAEHGAAGSSDEVRELLAGLRELVDRLVPPAGAAHAEEQARPAAESVPVSCDWCPLCTLAVLLRGQRTELAETALDYAGVLLGLLRAVLDDAVQHGGPAEPRRSGADPPGGRDTSAASEAAEGPSKVQRIPVRRRSTAGWQ